MKASIWKYPLNLIRGVQEVEMPEYAVIRDVQVQDGELVMWAEYLVENQYNKKTRLIEIVFTGYEFECGGVHLKTIQNIGLVYHVYDSGVKRY